MLQTDIVAPIPRAHPRPVAYTTRSMLYKSPPHGACSWGTISGAATFRPPRRVLVGDDFWCGDVSVRASCSRRLHQVRVAPFNMFRPQLVCTDLHRGERMPRAPARAGTRRAPRSRCRAALCDPDPAAAPRSAVSRTPRHEQGRDRALTPFSPSAARHTACYKARPARACDSPSCARPARVTEMYSYAHLSLGPRALLKGTRRTRAFLKTPPRRVQD